jgi:23S rRNA (pseudouridine1915-N3)-methyltransferase
MDFLIITVGKWKTSPERSLYDHYVKRVPWKVELRELVVKERDDAAKQQLEEVEKIQEACKQWRSQKIITLDEKGKSLSSHGFAQTIQQWQDQQAVGRVACVIGGHAGLPEKVIDQADLMISFGSMTWPHLLVRALLAEQIYRSYSILSGHPYHRE